MLFRFKQKQLTVKGCCGFCSHSSSQIKHDSFFFAISQWFHMNNPYQQNSRTCSRHIWSKQPGFFFKCCLISRRSVKYGRGKNIPSWISALELKSIQLPQNIHCSFIIEVFKCPLNFSDFNVHVPLFTENKVKQNYQWESQKYANNQQGLLYHPVLGGF